jgi:very-short-patch-repair endonuclease
MSRKRALKLRHQATYSERKLWWALRDLKKYGFHFRRQVPFGRYHADFACHRAKLIIELDGPSHEESGQRIHDSKRTAFLATQGYVVIRIWNADLSGGPDGMADYILQQAQKRVAKQHPQESSTPTRPTYAQRASARSTSPQGGGVDLGGR